MSKFDATAVRAQILEERPNEKYSTAKQLHGPRGLEIILKKVEKMSSFQMNPQSKPISFANLFPSGV